MNLMNPYVKNLNRLEFFITYACTGKCKHCSEGEHKKAGEHPDGEFAANIVRKVCGEFNIESLMTFGGEALLYPDVVCKIHMAAMEMNIPKRQLITNGFFTNDRDKIKRVVKDITESGINDICLSVDAFHQETIPLQPVKYFDSSNVPENPYEEDPKDVRAISISPNGDVLNGNVYQTDILDILQKYTP